MNNTSHFLRALTEWLFRRRSVGLSLVRTSVPILGLVLFGLSAELSIPTVHGPLVFSWNSTSGGSAALSWGVFFIVTSLMLLGVALILRDVWRERRLKVLVIEARGLRNWQGEPLVKAVPASVIGRREQVLVDVRQRLDDGQIVNPEEALRRITSLPYDIERRTDGLDRADVKFVLGGLAPVPFLFLLGVILDDESHTIFMDWDRARSAWRELDSEDDGKRFKVSGLSDLTPKTTRVSLCVSASYDILEADVRIVEPFAPIVRLELEERSTASHWSDEKQRHLSQQFLHVAMELASRGVTDVALFLAAPASLSLRLGTAYDKRNLPRLELSQFEQGDPRKFPWAVRMPVAGVAQAELVEH
jgi:hypothetical protein